MEKIRVLIIDEVLIRQGYYSDTLSNDEDIQVVGEVSSLEQVLKKIKQLLPDIVLMDLNLAHAEGVALTENITLNYPGVGVVLISSHNQPEFLKKGMMAGARDYLTKPIDNEELITSIKRAFRIEKERSASFESVSLGRKSGNTPPQIVTIMGTKGGVGKTTIAVNLAVELAQTTSKKVALLDFDLQFGDVAVFLNTIPKKSIAELVQERNKMDIELIESYLIPHISGVKILPSPTRPEYAELVTADNVMEILTILRDNYHYIIIDTPPFIPDTLLSALDVSTQIISVMSMEVPSVKNTKLCLELLDTLHHKGKVKMILNRVSEDFGITLKDVEETLDFIIAGTLPSDGKTVVKSINRGKPFVLSNPSAKVSKSIAEIGKMVIDDNKYQKDLLKLTEKRTLVPNFFARGVV